MLVSMGAALILTKDKGANMTRQAIKQILKDCQAVENESEEFYQLEESITDIETTEEFNIKGIKIA